jgi:hypothetical protein
MFPDVSKVLASSVIAVMMEAGTSETLANLPGWTALHL